MFMVQGTAALAKDNTNNSQNFFPKIAFPVKGTDGKYTFVEQTVSFEKSKSQTAKRGETNGFMTVFGAIERNKVRTEYTGSGYVWLFAVKQENDALKDRISNIIKFSVDFTKGTMELQDPAH